MFECLSCARRICSACVEPLQPSHPPTKVDMRSLTQTGDPRVRSGGTAPPRLHSSASTSCSTKLPSKEEYQNRQKKRFIDDLQQALKRRDPPWEWHSLIGLWVRKPLFLPADYDKLTSPWQVLQMVDMFEFH